MADWDGLIPEVKGYLNTHRDGYSLFLDRVMAELDQLRHRPECSRLIYSIYSRRDKQLGQSFKQDWKIAKKLHEWRADDPAAKASDIHDIIGITIVVNFPSDRDSLAGFLTDTKNIKCFKVYNTFARKERGYHAVHLLVQAQNIMEFPVERAEIQIKTMLHDGWGAKTHDLTYKPRGEIDQALHRHMEILGDVLQHLDDQSELIKDAIQERWYADQRLRDIARERLFLTLISGSHAAHGDDLKAIAQEIRDDRTRLATLDISDSRLTDLGERLARLKGQIGPGIDICRLYTFLASIRAAPDLLRMALSSIDEWRDATKGDIRQQVHAAVFRSLTYYASGRLEDAVESSRAALAEAVISGVAETITQAKSNLAYFLAEYLYNQPDRDPAKVREAMTLSEEALRDTGTSAITSTGDTRGAVLITLGSTEDEIRQGLRMCADAKARVPENRRELLDAYFRVHERRAFRRLLAME